MKSSDSERELRGRSCLIVDGYNVMARMAGTSLEQIEDMEGMRDQLLHKLSEYAAFTGEAVILVFDAWRTLDPILRKKMSGVRVIYTSAEETADERIERLVYELRDRFREITVATSDLAEQQVTFGGGALRVSADGLLRRLNAVEHRIQANIQERPEISAVPMKDRISKEIMNILEKWRRS